MAIPSVAPALDEKDDLLRWLGPEGAPRFLDAFRRETGRDINNKTEKSVRGYVNDLARAAYKAKGKEWPLGETNLQAIRTRVKYIVQWAHGADRPADASMAVENHIEAMDAATEQHTKLDELSEQIQSVAQDVRMLVQGREESKDVGATGGARSVQTLERDAVVQTKRIATDNSPQSLDTQAQRPRKQ